LTHVLFDGDIRRHPELRSLLWQWGVTVGRLSTDARTCTVPSVEDCDAVVCLGAENQIPSSDSSAMPDGAETEGAVVSAAAPLLVIGSWLQNESRKSPWISILDPGPGGSRLRAALQSCQERSRILRGDSEARQDQDQYRNFLGHELRSPLTAIKTALTVLAADKEPGSDAAKMLDIARRNLTRLAKTVEWSQEMLALSETPLTAALGPVSLATLAEAMSDHLDVQLNERDRTFEVMTDLGLLAMLAVQMERVLDYARPGGRVVFRLSLDKESRDGRLIATVVADPQGSSRPGNPRTGGVPAGQSVLMESGAEQQHLVRMLISPELLQALGVRVRLTCTETGTVELHLGLPGWIENYSPHTEPSLSV
jgi:hypothetical protein